MQADEDFNSQELPNFARPVHLDFKSQEHVNMPMHANLYDRTAHHGNEGGGGLAPVPGPGSSPAFRALDGDSAPVPGPDSSPAFGAMHVVGSQPNMRYPYLTDLECLRMRQSSRKHFKLFRD
eukprot:8335752-Karenia_brevis.AAC.1